MLRGRLIVVAIALVASVDAGSRAHGLALAGMDIPTVTAPVVVAALNVTRVATSGTAVALDGKATTLAIPSGRRPSGPRIDAATALDVDATLHRC